MQGHGREVHANGALFLGEYHDGVPHGHGVLSYPSGDCYEGQVGVLGVLYDLRV